MKVSTCPVTGLTSLRLDDRERATLMRAALIAGRTRARLRGAGAIDEDHDLDTVLSEIMQARDLDERLSGFSWEAAGS